MYWYQLEQQFISLLFAYSEVYYHIVYFILIYLILLFHHHIHNNLHSHSIILINHLSNSSFYSFSSLSSLYYIISLCFQSLSLVAKLFLFHLVFLHYLQSEYGFIIIIYCYIKSELLTLVMIILCELKFYQLN